LSTVHSKWGLLLEYEKLEAWKATNTSEAGQMDKPISSTTISNSATSGLTIALTLIGLTLRIFGYYDSNLEFRIL
jgi:hypothetical protein